MESERLYLRELKENDWLDVHQYASQSKVSLYQPWGPNSEEDSQSFVAQVLADAANDPRTRYVFAVIYQKEARMIGAGELNISDFYNRIGVISYIIHPDYWGKGIATEVAKLLINFGFRQFELHRIYATCDSRNIGSAKVLEKAGMRKEGRMREDLRLADGWRDSLLYSILEQEWDR